uniref:Fumarate reductase/succinate dehydrogenase flavoprotein-like C-terminal domain-containing protein n=1 Tax=Ascaris lumbricoides TaxID=6252 RepID=A0A0M3HX71_ASCLU
MKGLSRCVDHIILREEPCVTSQLRAGVHSRMDPKTPQNRHHYSARELFLYPRGNRSCRVVRAVEMSLPLVDHLLK